MRLTVTSRFASACRHTNAPALAACVVMSAALVACELSTGPSVGPAEIAAPTATALASPSPASPHSAEVCAGPDSAEIDLPRAARQYLAAWNEHDAAARLRILDDIWADNATYLDAPGFSDGPITDSLAMSDLVAQNQGPVGGWFEPRAWFESYAHHDLLLMPWRYCSSDGTPGVVGTDYAELDAGGRIVLAVGFVPLTPDGSGVDEHPTAACAGPDAFDWSAVPSIVGQYGAAWNTPAGPARDAIVDEIANDESTYINSFDEHPSVGRAEIKSLIDYGMVAGNYIELTAWGDADHHDGWFHARWRDCSANGRIFLEGTDILHVGRDGKLDRISSFWNEYIECVAAEC